MGVLDVGPGPRLVGRSSSPPLGVGVESVVVSRWAFSGGGERSCRGFGRGRRQWRVGCRAFRCGVGGSLGRNWVELGCSAGACEALVAWRFSAHSASVSEEDDS